MSKRRQFKITLTIDELHQIKSKKLRRLLDIMNKNRRPMGGPEGKAQDILDLIRRRQQDSDDDLE